MNVRKWRMTQRTVFAVWIVGPSAMGSVKGMPSSMMSASVSYLPFGIWSSIARRHTGTTSLHAEHDVRRILRRGIACGHIGDEGRLQLQLEHGSH
jgi:hypothetical protein